MVIAATTVWNKNWHLV